MADDTTSCRNVDNAVADDEMDGLRADVFSASRDGNVSQLRSLLDGRSKDAVSNIVSSTTNGASSLIMACRNGHAAVVSYLVTRCHADIHQVGSVTFDGEVRTAPHCALSFMTLLQLQLIVSVDGVIQQKHTFWGQIFRIGTVRYAEGL